MPAISTMVYPAPAYVRVEVNWADFAWATAAAVYRVDCLTGERVSLRPYVSFDGDFLDLSCGYGIFWDTEPQLDRCVYYCTQAIDSSGNAITAPNYPFADDFNRTVVDQWGTSTSGHTYTLSGGTVPGNWDVTGGKGTMTITSSATRSSAVDGLSVASGVLYGWYKHPVVPTGANHSAEVKLRYQDANNFIDLRMFLETGNTVTMGLRQVIGGVESAFTGFISVSGVTATSPLNFKVEFWGSTLRAKVWLSTDPEPAAWTAATTVTWLASGAVRFESVIPGGSTNVTPYTVQWDNFLLADPCAATNVVELCSDDLVVPSSGDFRLGDPVRPCNDVTLQLDAPVDPLCVPTQGIFFGNMADEEYPGNTGNLLPTNDPYPIVVSRARRSVGSTLTSVTVSFPDRDAMLQLLAAGSPTLLRGPAQYGIPDRYMSVGDVVVGRHLSDHRVSPRSISMPHVAVRRPSGPSQGVCGTRVEDLCDIYGSWSAIAAAGLTYADLLRGKASNDTPIPDTVERTWTKLNSDYASWTAVNAGEPDWNNALAGD